jgi:hypothetical protein
MLILYDVLQGMVSIILAIKILIEKNFVNVKNDIQKILRQDSALKILIQKEQIHPALLQLQIKII